MTKIRLFMAIAWLCAACATAQTAAGAQDASFASTTIHAATINNPGGSLPSPIAPPSIGLYLNNQNINLNFIQNSGVIPSAASAMPVSVPSTSASVIPIQSPAMPINVPTPSFTPFVHTTQPLPTDISRAHIPQLPTDLLPMTMSPHPGSFQFAHSSFQSIGATKNGFFVLPTRGTLYSVNASNRIKLAHGQLITYAETKDLQIAAGNTLTTISAGTSAIVKRNKGGLTRIYSLTNNEQRKPGIIITDSELPGRSISIPAGFDAVLPTESGVTANMVGNDNLSRRNSKQSDVLPNVVISEFSLSDLAAKSLFLPFKLEFPPTEAGPNSLNSKLASLPVTDTTTLLLKLCIKVKKQASNQSDFNSTTTPIPGPSLIAPKSNQHVQAIKHIAHDKDIFILASKDSEYKAASQNHVDLDHGTITLWSNNPHELNCGQHRLKVKPGTCCIVQYDRQQLKVINVCDLHKDAISIVSRNHSFVVPTASEIIVSDSAPDFANVYDIHQIGHRKLESNEVPELGWVTRSEISLVDALKFHPLLKTIRDDQNSSPKKKALDQLTKTAAIVNMIAARKGPYLRGDPSDLNDVLPPAANDDSQLQRIETVSNNKILGRKGQ